MEDGYKIRVGQDPPDKFPVPHSSTLNSELFIYCPCQLQQFQLGWNLHQYCICPLEFEAWTTAAHVLSNFLTYDDDEGAGLRCHPRPCILTCFSLCSNHTPSSLAVKSMYPSWWCLHQWLKPICQHITSSRMLWEICHHPSQQVTKSSRILSNSSPPMGDEPCQLV